jgi:hypothetical protein
MFNDIGPFCQVCATQRHSGQIGYHRPEADEQYSAIYEKQTNGEPRDFSSIQWWCWLCHQAKHEELCDPKTHAVSGYLLREAKTQLEQAMAQNESLRRALKAIKDLAKASEDQR